VVRQSFTSNKAYWAARTDYRKIIATTNKDLGLPQLSQEFIQQYVDEFNKGNIIKTVEVEYNVHGFGTFDMTGLHQQTTSILKINSDNTIGIKLIKDNFSRAEVINLINKFSYENCDDAYQRNDKWIKENL